MITRKTAATLLIGSVGFLGGACSDSDNLLDPDLDLHDGDVTGPEVAGTWSQSDDPSALTFTPAASLAPNTRYTIHLGGGMMDPDGDYLDLDTHGDHMGGDWAREG